MRTILGLLAVLLVAGACGKKETRSPRRIFVSTSDSTLALPMSLRDDVAAVAGVESVVAEVPVSWRDGDVLVWGVAADPEPLANHQRDLYALSEEDAARWLRDEDGIVVSKPLAERKHWSDGDSIGIELTSRSNERAASAAVDRYTIRGIFEAPTEEFAIHLASWRKIAGVGDDSVSVFVVSTTSDPRTTLDAISRVVEKKAPHARVMLQQLNVPVDAPATR
jgi:hypothetical protein